MTAADLKLEGLRGVQAALVRLGPAVTRDKRLELALRAGAREVAIEARRIAPVVSGELRSGIKVGRFTRRPEPVARAVSTAPHSHLVEFGTVRRVTAGGADRGTMPANPFMRVAKARRQAAIGRTIELALRDRVSFWARSLGRGRGSRGAA